MWAASQFPGSGCAVGYLALFLLNAFRPDRAAGAVPHALDLDWTLRTL